LQATEFFGFARTNFWRADFDGKRTLESYVQSLHQAHNANRSGANAGHIDWAENLSKEPLSDLSVLRLQLYFRLLHAADDRDTVNAVCDYWPSV
jgi:hypothetical protein